MKEGDTFGKLTAIRPYEGNSVVGNSWVFRCECGKEIICQPSLMRTRKTCGCGFTKICEVCGKEFVAFRSNVLTCSKECSHERYKKVRSAYKRGVRLLKKQAPKKEVGKISLGSAAAEARERGMTYGQMQAQKYLERISWVK